MNYANSPLGYSLLLLLLLQSTAQAEAKQDVTERYRATAQKAQQAQGIPGMSVAVAVGGEVVFAEGFGLADVEHNVAATPETAFRTASIAKSMTAVAVLQLAEQGKLDLDQPLDEYFHRFPKKRWPITARQLLCHQAGIRHYKRPGESYSTKFFYNTQEALETFSTDPLWRRPGSEFLYSSFGYNLLGAVAREVSGETFPDLLAKQVFQPAGMTATRTDNPYDVIPHRARGYIRVQQGKRIKLSTAARKHVKSGGLFNAPLHDTSMKVPGGGLVSTTPDLVRFANALMNGKLLGSQSLQAAWTAQQTESGVATQYGLGFRVMKVNGKKIVGHSGGQSGVSTYLLMCPERNVAAAVMCNLQNAEIKRLCMRLLLTAIHSAPPSQAANLTALTDTKGDLQVVVEKLTQFVEQQRKEKDLPAVSVSLVDNDKIVWAKGFGPEDPNTPADQDTIYRIGSVSKLFTDIALTQLVAQGKIDLDADIRTYLPDFAPENPYGIPITLRLLMSHRAGLIREPPVGNYFDPTEPTLEATVASVNQTKLVYKPGTRTKYSNAALGVVGLVVQKAAGRPFEEHMQQTMLKPMGMHGSSFFPNPKIKERQADAWMWGYDRKPFPAEDFVLGTYPAGNMYSSIEELSHLLVTIFGDGKYQGKQVVPAAVLKSMLEPTGEGDGKYQFGLGFALDTLDGHKTFGHGGAVYGYSTQFLGMPDEKIGVAVACAMDGTNGVMRRISHYAARLMLAHKASKPLPDPLTSTKPLPQGKASELEGYYTSGPKSLELYEYNHRLMLRHGDFTRELRDAGNGTLVVDDRFGYGATIKLKRANVLDYNRNDWTRQPETLPEECPKRWHGLIGEYGWDHNTLFIYEDRGKLYALIEWFYDYPLTEIEENVFAFPAKGGLYHGEKLYFTRDASDKATQVVAAEVKFDRRPVGLADGEVFQIKPVLPMETLRRNALDAKPPHEARDFRPSSLTELTSLDPTIKKDIRYAADTNFLGAPVYKSADAFMQRPAAKALVKAHESLASQGFGLLIYDAYRPWFVTRMFWDGTPDRFHMFTANPDRGSLHNRGCAVDLSLYDLKTGKPVDVVAGYDEFSPRSYPLYPGGTAQQRWHRRLLRNAMEAQGFTVNKVEWWHFDYKDWRHYAIQNAAFEDLK